MGGATYVETKEQEITCCQSCDELLQHVAGFTPVGGNAMSVVLVPRGRGVLLESRETHGVGRLEISGGGASTGGASTGHNNFKSVRENGGKESCTRALISVPKVWGKIAFLGNWSYIGICHMLQHVLRGQPWPGHGEP